MVGELLQVIRETEGLSGRFQVAGKEYYTAWPVLGHQRDQVLGDRRSRKSNHEELADLLAQHHGKPADREAVASSMRYWMSSLVPMPVGPFGI